MAGEIGVESTGDAVNGFVLGSRPPRQERRESARSRSEREPAEDCPSGDSQRDGPRTTFRPLIIFGLEIDAAVPYERPSDNFAESFRCS